MTQRTSIAPSSNTVAPAANNEIVSRTKGNFSLTVFTPRDGQNHLGAFKSQNNPGVMFLRLACSTTSTDANGDFDNEGWGQTLVFGDLARELGMLINETPSGHITIRASSELQIQVTIGKKPTDLGKPYHNKVYQIYGFSFNGMYYSTKAGKLTITEDVIAPPMPVGRTQQGRMDFASLVRPGTVAAAAQPHVNAPATPAEDAWAEGALADLGGTKRNKRAAPTSRR